MPRHPERSDAAPDDVTGWLCPDRPDADQLTTHHLVPIADEQRCTYCGRNRTQIAEANREEDKAAVAALGKPVVRRCWCGGAVGTRTPGDAMGLGCLENIHHVWSEVRDSRGRDARIHGMVLDSANPARTLRELLRQWHLFGDVVLDDLEDEAPRERLRDLMERTQAALQAVDVEGRVR